MKFPYGVCDFYKIITEGFFYIDRTDRIPLLEDADQYVLFLRPRRFGKSLLLSMLENYYDVAKADDFEKLFGHLAIGQNPTPKHNQYFVLKWDFSEVSPLGAPEHIQQNLFDYLNGAIQAFAKDYQDLLTETISIYPQNATESFNSLLTAVRQTSYKLYLLIDEYDNFANEVMMGQQAPGVDRYKALTHGEGCLKALFKVIKAATAGKGLDRIFITGVSPVVMSDITSGHNISKDISLRPKLNDLCGFQDDEVQATLSRVAKECDFSEEQIAEMIETVRTFYNGYSFSYTPMPRVYNPTLVLYFLGHLQENRTYPRNMLDSNLAMDKGKIAYIAGLSHGASVVASVVNEAQPVTIDLLADSFGVEDMLHATKDTTFMMSLLYYFGVLTLRGEYTASGRLILAIPNLVIRKLYAEKIHVMLFPEFDTLEEAEKRVEQFYLSGALQPVCELIEEQYFAVLDNRDYRWANELTVKTAFLVVLFNDAFYIMDSEPALERRYADLSMIVRPDMRRFQLLDHLIEFKYVSLQDLHLSGEQVRRMSQEELHALPAVQTAYAEAKTALRDYRRTLETTYGDRLRLHTHCVVAIGFDRLVCQTF